MDSPDSVFFKLDISYKFKMLGEKEMNCMLPVGLYLLLELISSILS